MEVKRIPMGKRGEPERIDLVEGIYRVGSEPQQWFVVQTNPQCEDKVARGLVAKKVSHYVPRRKKAKPQSKKQKVQRKRKEAVSRPLLGRYVFAALPVDNLAFGRIREVEGVGGLLCGDEGGPLQVSTALVEEIGRREGEGEFDKVSRRRRRNRQRKPKDRGFVVPTWVEEGADVRVKRGPFETFAGSIEEVLGDNRVKVSLSLFGRWTPVELEIEELEAA